MKKLLLRVAAVSIGFGSIVLAGAPSGFGDDSQQEDLNVPGTDQLQDREAATDIIKGAINWIIGILGLIALIVMMIGGFFMLTAAGDTSQYEKGRQYLKGAAIGILIIGIAWFIASLAFFLVDILTEGVGPANTQN